MSGRFLLDTNIVIALFGRDSAIQERLAQVEEVFVPSIVLGELYFGARKSSQVEKNLSRIDELAVTSPILACNAETARIYGAIKDALRVKGRPIPENDIWIAAIAEQHGMILVTRDAHFDKVEDLNIEQW